jgi:hypothetical protein
MIVFLITVERKWDQGNGVKLSKFGYHFSPKVLDLSSLFNFLIQPPVYSFITSLTADPSIPKYLPISLTLLTMQYSNPSQSNFEALTPTGSQERSCMSMKYRPQNMGLDADDGERDVSRHPSL